MLPAAPANMRLSDPMYCSRWGYPHLHRHYLTLHPSAQYLQNHAGHYSMQHLVGQCMLSQLDVRGSRVVWRVQGMSVLHCACDVMASVHGKHAASWLVQHASQAKHRTTLACLALRHMPVKSDTQLPMTLKLDWHKHVATYTADLLPQP